MNKRGDKRNIFIVGFIDKNKRKKKNVIQDPHKTNKK